MTTFQSVLGPDLDYLKVSSDNPNQFLIVYGLDEYEEEEEELSIEQYLIEKSPKFMADLISEDLGIRYSTFECELVKDEWYQWGVGTYKVTLHISNEKS